MPTKPLTPQEIEGIDHLVKVACELLEHPETSAVRENSPDLARSLLTVWGTAWEHCSRNPTRRVLTKALADKLSEVAQRAADTLSHPDVARIPFAVRSTMVATPLREVVRRMKAFRR